ncbi:sugar O-acetyltransferase [Aeromonas schubertii]|uniref:Nodulation protein L n=1 Tax=Aeromonas schubertii TaxID=652 RepID=A0A0S2SCU7_9GAMM|nr:sugar O-acetyltransferase [Aeromonas schubertii]ALP39442.1 maltose O-acetyltransferase [Aeromonas schubertii]KUE81146.1 maltose acetyltransferase [Aeromonas schubertii]MBZ6073394.1 sugar O-acetyltransferase [Aeromonas schubertii]QCG49626.1 sugar O-acetyltransferase [Aeromonas schubertii]
MASDWDKILAGGLLDSSSEEVANDRIRGQALLTRLNATPAGEESERQALCRELFGHCPESSWISTPFTCEFGRNIHIGEKSFLNFNVTILDVCEVHIGSHVLLAPNVQIYTATHSMDYRDRRRWEAFGKPVHIGDDCWIGGGAILCPGVTIGPRSVIGAGAVVTRDIPADSVAVGNPARVIRTLSHGEPRDERALDAGQGA